MHISNSFSSLVTSGVNSKATAAIKNSQRVAEPVSQVEQEQSSNKQAKPSIVLDEQAIALFEQNQASVLTQAQLNNESLDFDNTTTSPDQPSAKNETAVASYQAVGNLAQRESVQQLFGVDVFA